MIDYNEFLEDAKEYADEIVKAASTRPNESSVYFSYSNTRGYVVALIRNDQHTTNQSLCFGLPKTKKQVFARIEEERQHLTECGLI